MLFGRFCAALNRGLGPGITNQGVFGDPTARGCQAYKEGTEGSFIEIAKNGREYNILGECNCKIRKLTKNSTMSFALTTVCACVEGNKERGRHSLEILNSKEIVYDKTRYKKC